ncbi:uncharacterized protein LOC143909962 [Arctopsyche grandis]|uniref:uncharacterized protein LOC143909962 n=1 Tax=Arctopsyche grandis TaxID=121162 RepID=UPI00406D8AB7
MEKCAESPFKLDANFKLEEKLLDFKKQLMEKTEELRKRDQTIAILERDLDNRDSTIRYLKIELDKYKQVVRPLTQRIAKKKAGDDFSEDDDCLMMKCRSNGVENTRVLRVHEPKMKRTAISAEPLSSICQSMDDLKIDKVEKTPEWDCACGFDPSTMVCLKEKLHANNNGRASCVAAVGFAHSKCSHSTCVGAIDLKFLDLESRRLLLGFQINKDDLFKVVFMIKSYTFNHTECDNRFEKSKGGLRNIRGVSQGFESVWSRDFPGLKHILIIFWAIKG